MIERITQTASPAVTFDPPAPGQWELETAHHGLRPLSPFLRDAYRRAFEAGIVEWSRISRSIRVELDGLDDRRCGFDHVVEARFGSHDRDRQDSGRHPSGRSDKTIRMRLP